MRWETGSAKPVPLGLEWLWESSSFFLLSFSKQTFSDSWTTTSGVYPVGLKSETPKVHQKSLSAFRFRGSDMQMDSGKKDTFNVCWQFHQCSLRLYLLRCQTIRFHRFEVGSDWDWPDQFLGSLVSFPNFQVTLRESSGTGMEKECQ